jgi:hypothetical protein
MVGFGPSTVQSFVISGEHLINNVNVTPTTNYEISLLPDSGFQSTPISITPASGIVLSTIFVRLKAGISYGGGTLTEIITVRSVGAPSRNVICSGNITMLPYYYGYVVANSIDRPTPEICFNNIVEGSKIEILQDSNGTMIVPYAMAFPTSFH